MTKIGCAINDDSLEMFSYSPSISLRGRFDLGGLSGTPTKPVGLKNATQTILNVTIPKNRKLMLSDWSKKLSDDQLEYACRDAWAGYECFSRLREKFSEEFSDSILRDIFLRQLSVKEMHVRRRNRKIAKREIKFLKSQGMGFNSVQAKPHRKMLNENRPERVPIFNKLGLVFEQREVIDDTFSNEMDQQR